MTDSWGGASGDGVTALVIDDEEVLRHLVRRALEPNVCAVVDAANGEEGLLAVERNDPPVDLVLTDLVMPVIDGWTVAEVLRRHRPDLPVICMSGYSGDDATVPRSDDLCVPLLAKPFRADLLVEIVSKAIENTKRARADAQQSLANEAKGASDRTTGGKDAVRHRATGLVAAARDLHQRMRGADGTTP